MVLGLSQDAARVLDAEATRRSGFVVARRATSGIAAAIDGRAVIFALALPAVNSLFPDATPRTLLNRNVRGFLRGFARAGAPAAYLGRAVVSIHKRPAAILGFEVREAGEVLVELIAGFDAPLALPPDLSIAEEREVARSRGDLTVALARVTTLSPLDFGARVLASILGAGPETLALPSLSRAPAVAEPWPLGFVRGLRHRVPIGFLDTARHPDGRLWLGGDVLAPRWALDAVAAGDSPSEAVVALDGARLSDLVAARDAAAAG